MTQIITQKVNRFSQFWEYQGEWPVLMGIRLPMDHAALYGVNHGKFAPGDLHPNDVHPEIFLNDFEASFEVHQGLGDDVVFTITPWWGIPWTEAIMGCAINSDGGTVWAESHQESFNDLDASSIIKNNQWVDKLLECLRVLVEFASGRFAVAPVVLRNGGDVASALRGTDKFFYDLYDRPEETKNLMKLIADTVIAVNRLQIETIPPFQGGTSNYLGAWTPGTNTMLSDDTSALISPKFYTQFIEDGHRRQTETSAYTIMHLHSTGLVFLDRLLTMPNLSGVQIVMERKGPSLTDLLPVLKRITRSNKRLILVGNKREDLTNNDVQYLVKALEPDPVYIIVERDSVEGAAILSKFL